MSPVRPSPPVSPHSCLFSSWPPCCLCPGGQGLHLTSLHNLQRFAQSQALAGFAPRLATGHGDRKGPTPRQGMN